MAQSTTLVLIPSTPLPGNALITSLVGTAQKAASYYVAGKSTQTATWNMTTPFAGTVTFQASLVTSPTESDWFDVYSTTTPAGFTNIIGNFVWVRANVSAWTLGAINNISLTY